MRRYALLLADGLALSPVAAKADFTLSNTRTDLSTTDLGGGTATGTDAGMDLIQIFAKSSGTNMGTKAESIDATLTDNATGHTLVIGYPTPTRSTTAADITGVDEVFTNTTGTAYQFGGANPAYYSFINLLGDPSSAADSNPANFTNIAPAPVFGTQGFVTPSLTVTGINANGGVDAMNANGGKGALIAVAVVPHGDDVTLTGNIGGDAGPTQALSYSTASAVPEPASLGVMGLAIAGLIARRRRA